MTRFEIPGGLKRRLHISALLIGACVAVAPRASRAEDAPKESEKSDSPAPDAKPADTDVKADADTKVDAPKAAEAAPAAAPATPVANTDTPVPPPPAPVVKDDLDPAGYVPGYRKSLGLGMAPWVPKVGSVPGGFTPSFAAPSPLDDWNFNFTGYMSAALRTSWSERKSAPGADQSSLSFHSVPVTADQYGTFTGTNTVPGSWADMTLQYGNKYVTGYVSMATYDPSRAASYVNPGSQYFINNVYMTIRVPPIDRTRLALTVGAVPNFYGALGQYGVGAYAPYIIGWVPGVGETMNLEYDLADGLTLQVEQGLRGVLSTPPQGTPNNNTTGFASQYWPASWVHHEHIGILHKGDVQIQAGLHYFYNWSQDDRNVQKYDDTNTRGVDEAHIKDGHITEIAADFRMLGGRYGYYTLAAAYTKGQDSQLLTGLNTYGGTGVRLLADWWGPGSGGNGTLFVVGTEYTLSLGTLLRYPQPFWGEGPDLVVMASFHHAQTTSPDPTFDGRARNKFGTEWTYRLLSWFGVGARFDAVEPNSKDSQESFTVLTPKLYFKSNWTSHELVTLQYARWFYGAHTSAQGTDPVAHENLDNQMVAVAFSMWW
jgi:hypothetical protein